MSDFVDSPSQLIEFLEAPEDILEVEPVHHQNLPLKWQKIYEATKPSNLKVIKFSEAHWESLNRGLFITAASLNAYYSNEKYLMKYLTPVFKLLVFQSILFSYLKPTIWNEQKYCYF